MAGQKGLDEAESGGRVFRIALRFVRATRVVGDEWICSSIAAVFLQRDALRYSQRRSMPAAVNRLRLIKEREQDVIDLHVVDLLEARVRDAGHHAEGLVRTGQQREEFDQVVETGDAVEFAAHDDGGGLDFFRIDHRQLRTHVDIGAGRHRVVELEHAVGENFDDLVFGAARMVAREHAQHEGTVERASVDVDELRQLLAALFERRAALTRPDECVERQPRSVGRDGAPNPAHHERGQLGEDVECRIGRTKNSVSHGKPIWLR